MKKLYIITGANGFLGNNVVRALEQDPENEIRALVLPGDSTASLDGLRCAIFRGDVTRKETLEELFRDAENRETYVVHCAAIVYIKSKYNAAVYNVNVNGTKNVAEQVLQKNARLVYVSSVHAIPEPPGNQLISEISEFDPARVKGQYAQTKAETANYILEQVRKRALNACIVHPSGLIGPNDFGSSHLTQLVIDFCSGRLTACVRGGYDFVDVRDVAAGILSACSRGKRGACYILSNRYAEIREVLDLISEVRNSRKIKTVLPMWLARQTAPLSELYYTLRRQPPLYTKYSLYALTSNANFTNAKAAGELGYKTRPLKDTIRDTVRWLEAQRRILPLHP